MHVELTYREMLLKYPRATIIVTGEEKNITVKQRDYPLKLEDGRKDILLMPGDRIEISGGECQLTLCYQALPIIIEENRGCTGSIGDRTLTPA